MIIEFTGAPCSGKSDISKKVGNLLQDDGKSVCQNQYLLSHNSGKFKRLLIKCGVALKNCILHPRKSLSALKAVKSKGIWLNYLYIVGCTSKCNYLIFEQGICQCIGSMFDGKIVSAETIVDITNTLLPEKPDRLFVFVDVSPKTIMERMELRPENDKPFYGLVGDPNCMIEKSVATVETIRNVIMNRYGSDCVITVNNDEYGRSKVVAGKIYKAIKDRF